MGMATLPAGITVREAAHWRLRTSTFSPGRALNGRQQFIAVENRTWEVEYGIVGAWDAQMGAWLAFLDAVGGPKTSFLVPVRNDLTVRYGGDPAAFYTALGFTATEIANGYQTWSDGTTFSDGTGWALPSTADPVLTYAAPAGASRIWLDNYLGRVLAVGAYFAIDNFLYRVQSNDNGDIRFNPPLRTAVAAGAPVEVNAPRARVRFPDDAAFADAIEIKRFYGSYKISVVEAFDR